MFLWKIEKFISLEPEHQSGWKVVLSSCNGLVLMPVPKNLSIVPKQFLTYYWLRKIFFPKNELGPFTTIKRLVHCLPKQVASWLGFDLLGPLIGAHLNSILWCGGPSLVFRGGKARAQYFYLACFGRILKRDFECSAV